MSPGLLQPLLQLDWLRLLPRLLLISIAISISSPNLNRKRIAEIMRITEIPSSVRVRHKASSGSNSEFVHLRPTAGMKEKRKEPKESETISRIGFWFVMIGLQQ